MKLFISVLIFLFALTPLVEAEAPNSTASAYAAEHEDLLRRMDSFDERIDILLRIYSDLFLCNDEKCMREVREKYIIGNVNKHPWDDMMWGTLNMGVAIRKVLLEQIISELKTELRKKPGNKEIPAKLKKYESQYKKLLEFEKEGYD